MINYTDSPDEQIRSKEIMVALQHKYGIGKVLAQDDKLVLIGDDWCYKADDGLQLLRADLAAKLCMRLGEESHDN